MATSSFNMVGECTVPFHHGEQAKNYTFSRVIGYTVWWLLNFCWRVSHNQRGKVQTPNLAGFIGPTLPWKEDTGDLRKGTGYCHTASTAVQSRGLPQIQVLTASGTVSRYIKIQFL